MSVLLDRIVRTEPLDAEGKSGSKLERAWLDDGSVVVIKRADGRDDWIMQATGDNGRIADLWADGLFARLPARIEHAILDVQPAPTGAVVVMRDVSSGLEVADALPELHDRLLQSAAEMHATMAAARPQHLCSLEAYYAFLSPQVCERFAAAHLVPRLALEGWARFHEIVGDDVADAIAAVHARPGTFAHALESRPATLVHGDLKLANTGLDPDRVIILDWGTLTTWAPAAVDYAWYLAINGAALGRDHDELIRDVRAAEPECDEIALGLALLGALAQLGWEKALGATADDPAVRAREQAGLGWWLAQARRTLESWSP